MTILSKVWFVVGLIMSGEVYADFSNLTKGVSVNDNTLNELSTSLSESASAYGTAWLSQESVGAGVVNAFLKVPSSLDLFSLSAETTLELHLTNFDTEKHLGRWTLTRWPHELYMPETSEQILQEADVVGEPVPVVTKLLAGEEYNGCLSQAPLRYGDFDKNGSNEIIVMADEDIVVFSPEKKKVIFQMRWEYDHYDGDYENDKGKIYIHPDNKSALPQYRDPNVEGQFVKGVRAYAKMYAGEFNANQIPDIVVWYKVYESNMPNEALGFHKIRDVVRHYELITKPTQGVQPTGEYLPLPTKEAVIRKWLADKSLTWQKGYPNLSECPGKTAQPIADMVDPLLNDPDVLK